MIEFNPRWDKGSFVCSIPYGGRVLDVGCGNNSPQWIKEIRPDLYYIGIDVGDYNQQQNPNLFADEYVITSPESFSACIDKFSGSIDAVISSHNLEHCNEPDEVVRAMLAALAPGGKLYCSFPCEESVGFPRRGGCLNFFDDNTHKVVPSWKNTIDFIVSCGYKINYKAKRYRPFVPFLKGLIKEPVSFFKKKVCPDGSTWALYGFESIIWVENCSESSEARIIDWGDRQTKAGVGVNLQQNGNSALWIKTENISAWRDVFVYFRGAETNRVMALVQKDIVTVEIPQDVINTKGEYGVYIREASGRETHVGDFLVN